MKIAVASEKNDIKAEVYPTAGRAPYYLIFEDKKLIKSIKNPFAIGGGGAGYGVIQMLSNENVDLVISGNFGPNMITVFKEKEMKYKIIQNMIVEEVLEVEKG